MGALRDEEWGRLGRRKSVGRSGGGVGAVREEERDPLGRRSGGNMGGHRVEAVREKQCIQLWRRSDCSEGRGVGGNWVGGVGVVRVKESVQLGKGSGFS